MKKCILCNKEINNNNNQYCSRECYKTDVHNKRIKFTCKNCGEEFFKKPQSNCKNLFCTPECGFEYKRKSIKRYCLNCNSELASNQKEYCNKQCKIKHKTKEYTCHHCNNKFNYTREKKYCSKECQLEANKKQMRERKKKLFVHETKKCKYCGNEFKTQYKKSKTFCSDECIKKMKNLRSKMHDGKRAKLIKHNGGIDSDITLKKIYKKSNGICAICGGKCDYKDYKLDDYKNFITGNQYPSIDHIIPISKGGTHTWQNIQLAHRICNSYKGSGFIEKEDGQLSIF